MPKKRTSANSRLADPAEDVGLFIRDFPPDVKLEMRIIALREGKPLVEKIMEIVAVWVFQKEEAQHAGA